MINETVARRHIRGAARLAIVMALIAVPGLALAQDDRFDDPPDPAQAATPTPVPAVSSFLTQPRFLTNAVQRVIDRFGDNPRQKNGWYVELSNMITGSGFVSAGPGYRRYLFNKQAFVDGSAAVSWHLYNMAQLRFEAPDIGNHHFTLGTQGMWQDATQVNYWGIGPDTLDADQSQYQVRSFDAVGYGAYRPNDWLTFSSELGYLFRPHILAPGGTFKPNFPEAQQAFPNDPGMNLPFQPNFLHSETAVTADTRDYRGHPTRGSLYRAAFTTYSDRSTGEFSFNQYEAEGLHLFQLNGPRWILALHGWLLWSGIPSGNEIPFYLIPSLGGQNTLRGYSNYRFHDNDLLYASAESRWALFTNVDGAVFVDAGNVAPVFGDLNLNQWDVGAGLRLHTQRYTWARVDVAHGLEGWNVLFRTTDPLRLGRVTRRIAAIPFVP
jgi:Omp85 superfamily domain